MKRLLILLFACAIVLLNFVFADTTQAQPLIAISLPLQNVEMTEQQKELLEQLETNVLPQIESILSPEQREQFSTAVADGESFRKAFKSLSLNPDQKAKLGTLFKSLPKKDFFASLAPEQRKEFFMKKKELFAPTPEEIGEKVREKMKMAQDKDGDMPTPEEIGEKIKQKMKMAKSNEE